MLLSGYLGTESDSIIGESVPRHKKERSEADLPLVFLLLQRLS